jgi:hypothetical protein
MVDLNPVQALIVQLSAEEVSEADLRAAVMQAHPELTEAGYQSAIFSLQEADRLIGREVDGDWTLAAIDKSDPNYAHPEYSSEFAEKIIAVSCEDFVEISADDLIAQLDAMLEKARAKKPGTA